MFKLLAPAAVYTGADYYDDKKINGSLMKRKGFLLKFIISLAANPDLNGLIYKMLLNKDGDNEETAKIVSKVTTVVLSLLSIFLVLKEKDKFEGENLPADLSVIATNVINLMMVA